MKSKLSKLLHPVLGRPVIDWACDQAFWLGEKIVFVVGHQREAVEAQLARRRPQGEIGYALQAEPRGTGHAVQMALKQLDEWASPETTIFIMGGDAFLLMRETAEAFLQQHLARRAHLSLITTYLKDPAAYGRIVRNSDDKVVGIVEAKDATPEQLLIHEINAGFYLVNYGVLKAALQNLENNNKAGEFYLTDLVQFCDRQNLIVNAVDAKPEECLGINTQEELAMVAAVLRQRINKFWMSQGVMMEDPQSTVIESDVRLSTDVKIEPGVFLKGHSRIHSGVKIGAYSVIEDSEVGEESHIEAYTHLKQAVVGAQCHLGPFARLRPGSILDEKVHIGNFVEIKKSHLKTGVKAGHLAYLGDAQIGAQTNIGAGTITCNYDGVRKHETVLGDRVFVGSNTSLVAPVNVGDGALIGAGSVITKDVSASSIALERSEQREISGAAERFLKKSTK
jgi:bifunctional UDP-N-acetylglucosamine pyrophosphorylase/glucosamine-1-phosphate N-acetyltransferase